MYTTGLMERGMIPQVAVGGRLAQIQFFGDAPGYPGYYQVNFQAPAGIAAGSRYPGYYQVNVHVPDGDSPGAAVSVPLTYLGRPSNEVTIAVQ